MSRLPTGKIRIRFKRAYRGYRPGDEISPPAGARQMILESKTPLGEPVAEEVKDDAQAAPEAPAPKKKGRPPKKRG